MKENSIEEDIKQLKLILKVRKEQKEIIECAGGSCINCNPDIEALTNSINILSDYKRVLKENEEWDRKFCDLQNLYFKLQDESELKRKEYQETYKDVREELKELKKENIELESQLEEEKKNRQLYEGTLVTLSEFRQRDIDNKNEINRLKNKIKEKEQEINNVNSQLNTYKIRQIEYDKREKNLKK